MDITATLSLLLPFTVKALDIYTAAYQRAFSKGATQQNSLFYLQN